jgi:hypothetical protein
LEVNHARTDWRNASSSPGNNEPRSRMLGEHSETHHRIG